MILADIFKDAFDFIFPRRCVVCRAQLDDKEENFVCLLCLESLPQTGYHLIKDNLFEERFAGRIPFDRGTALYFYDRGGPVSSIVHDFKYHDLPGLATEMGREMYRQLSPAGFLDGVDAVIPIGTHVFRLLERGYNQTLKLAEGLAESSDLDIIDCLRMKRFHRSQTKRNATERTRSVSNLFKVKGNPELKDKHVLLLDDICTTGSTMVAAAEALLAYDPSIRLRLLTLACTY